MSAQQFTSVDVYAAMRSRIGAAGSQVAYAGRIGVSPQFLSDVLNGRRDVPAAVLTDLGLRRITRFVRVSNEDTSNVG